MIMKLLEEDKKKKGILYYPPPFDLNGYLKKMRKKKGS